MYTFSNLQQSISWNIFSCKSVFRIRPVPQHQTLNSQTLNKPVACKKFWVQLQSSNFCVILYFCHVSLLIITTTFDIASLVRNEAHHTCLLASHCTLCLRNDQFSHLRACSFFTVPVLKTWTKTQTSVHFSDETPLPPLLHCSASTFLSATS